MNCFNFMGKENKYTRITFVTKVKTTDLYTESIKKIKSHEYLESPPIHLISAACCHRQRLRFHHYCFNPYYLRLGAWCYCCAGDN